MEMHSIIKKMENRPLTFMIRMTGRSSVLQIHPISVVFPRHGAIRELVSMYYSATPTEVTAITMTGLMLKIPFTGSRTWLLLCWTSGRNRETLQISQVHLMICILRRQGLLKKPIIYDFAT